VSVAWASRLRRRAEGPGRMELGRTRPVHRREVHSAVGIHSGYLLPGYRGLVQGNSKFIFDGLKGFQATRFSRGCLSTTIRPWTLVAVST
jgi:hypothetical protein